VASLSVPYESCYTVVPFDSGNVSIAESGNQMTVYTARTRPDGHQSNIAIRINTDTMTIKNNYGMIDSPDIHVSHSFRQIVTYDAETPIYVDLGDGSPRAVCLQYTPGKRIKMLSVAGDDGDNETDTDVSGVAVTDTGYLVVGTQLKDNCNNIYLSYVAKDGVKANVTWLTGVTSYQYSNVCNTKIIQVSEGVYAVMWNRHDGISQVNYVMVDSQGNVISGLKTLPDAELTECEPILDDGKVTWVKYMKGKQVVYSLSDFSCTGNYEWEDTYVYPNNNLWDGSADTSWYDAEKSEFVLTTPQQLAGFAALVNDGNTFEGKRILLGSDMFLNPADSTKYSWDPIASRSSGISFEGTFDGQGHTLYNLYTSRERQGGLFGVIGTNGIVKAVRVSQGFICGAAVAYENQGWILFCENNSLIYGTMYAAGICDINENLVYGCSNTGTVEGNNAGGIISVNSTDVSTIDSCWNQGYVGGTGFTVAGIVSDARGWIYDCYNAGTVSGIYMVNYAKTVCGIVGGFHADTNSATERRIYNCYNIGHLDLAEEWSWYLSDTICGEGADYCKNVYSLPSEYNAHATEVTAAELESSEAVSLLGGDKIITKWSVDSENLNNGYVIPIAQQDWNDGVYKILPDVWNPTTEVSIQISDKDYELKAYSSAYYGVEAATAVYSSESDKLSITPEGIITPKKLGIAVVKVTFAETEHTKEVSYDVTVTIGAMRGDANLDGQVDLTDLMLCLHHVSGRRIMSGQALAASDVDGNGTVDLQDLMKILHYVSGRNSTL
jgi:hypothetical protein